MDNSRFNQQLLAFLKASPTPFHAVQSMIAILESNGFSAIEESDSWDLGPGRYYVTRNQSSIIGFVLGREALETGGIRMVGAHTDSPCLKVKPIPEKLSHGYNQLGVEVYGGVLLNPWFDRDLSIAGRVTLRHGDGSIHNQLIDLVRPVAIIPSLAIHLDREANQARSINPETDIPPVLLQGETKFSFADLISDQTGGAELLATDLCFYDTNAPAIIGANDEFIASARLDNLLSCFTGVMSLIETDGAQSSLLVCNDHEEVGSVSATGAAGTFLKDVLERMTPAGEARYRTYRQSLLISTDNAHGIHPNYPSKHESNHGPILNQGPALKFNANQRYATNSETAGYFTALCRDNNIPCQAFVNRADMACGSTIGPITAKEIGIRTLDVGVPTFAMHSIRELAGTADAFALHQVLKAFYAAPAPLGAA